MSKKGFASKDFIFVPRSDGGLDFVGDFEGLYRTEQNPWGQSGEDERLGEYFAFSRTNLAGAIDRHAPRSSVLEIGCGLGYVCDFLARALPDARVEGLDISATAVAKARSLFPTLAFHHGDIGSVDFQPPKTYGTVILNQILWYVLGTFDQTMANCAKMAGPGGLVIISTAFLEDQRYGREIIDGFNGLVQALLDRRDRFTLIEARYDDGNRFSHHDGLLVARVRA